MAEPARRRASVEEYLALEESAEYKSEYFDGEIFAMSGGTGEHNEISVNISGELRDQLRRGPCHVYSSDQRVKIPDTGLYTYPDVVVVCEEPLFEGRSRRTLLSPTLIVEVLSEGTEAYDRGDKFAHYRRLASLKEYVLVASDRPRIERFTRQEGGTEWLLAVCDDPQSSLALPSIGCVLSLPDVYLKVVFPPRPAGRRRGPR